MKEDHQAKEKLHSQYKLMASFTKADYGTNKWYRLTGIINALKWALYGDMDQ